MGKACQLAISRRNWKVKGSGLQHRAKKKQAIGRAAFADF